jgi:futalosine hydrolase
MALKILYVTATSAEAESLRNIRGIETIPEGYRLGKCEIALLITGVGSIATAWAMKQWISVNERPYLVINGGIAGSYNEEIKIGDVVMPVTDLFADAGIEDGDSFLTMSEAGMAGSNEFPFREGLLPCDSSFVRQLKSFLKPVKAITVNCATGSEATTIRLQEKYNPDIETMEGATFFYICARENIPFLALRSISNMVGPRNKDNWDIRLALDNLSEKLREVILTLD